MAIAFTKVKLPWGWLGNMSGHEVRFDDKVWPTAEALFQALRFSDPAIREAIRAERNPMKAKFLAKGKADQMTVAPMSEQDVANMEVVVRAKLDSNPHLVDELLVTGEELIVEDITNRGKGGNHAFWGAALVGDTWVGENTLGKVWMKIRTERRQARQ
jgi:predicted NAD-dependent protein-ADP-ribosyltransferase YbiA (DUF1768 family)